MKNTPRFILALALAGAFVSTSASAAESGPYIRINAGPVLVRDIGVESVAGVNTPGLKIQTETGLGLSAVAGLKLNQIFALELETGFLRGDFKSIGDSTGRIPATGDFSMVPILLNGVLTGKLSESVSANFGAGIGAAVTSAEIGAVGINLERQTKTTFMGQLKTGVEFKLTESISADLSYRLGLVDGPAFDLVKTKSIMSHMFTAGIGIKF